MKNAFRLRGQKGISHFLFLGINFPAVESIPHLAGYF
jgi:hypothetical protein